jgi:hypothetical protein
VYTHFVMPAAPRLSTRDDGPPASKTLFLQCSEWRWPRERRLNAARLAPTAAAGALPCSAASAAAGSGTLPRLQPIEITGCCCVATNSPKVGLRRPLVLMR